MEKQRYIAITDIFYGFEVDDIQSMIRLFTYANQIDIEGLITCTSCFVTNGTFKHKKVIHDIIDAYEKVVDNLNIHEPGYPSANYLRSITKAGIPVFGKRKGRGFAEDKYNDNEGVNHIISIVDKDDPRPVYIGLWGGGNTLAQAIYKVSKTRSTEALNVFLSKLRIYSVSDQDYAGKWMRDNYGDRLFYIDTPSKGWWFGNWTYYRGTWPGISADHFQHGSEDGTRTKGFTGARDDLISNDWLDNNIRNIGPLGKLYPRSIYIMEGDTPSFFWLLPNGLSDPIHPNYGSWGGRYEYYLPSKEQFKIKEKYPIWTSAVDTVLGTDGLPRTSSQATIWRWREAYQNDFKARMEWTINNNFSECNHPPVIKTDKSTFECSAGDSLTIRAIITQPNNANCSSKWTYYKEAGTFKGNIELVGNNDSCTLLIPEDAKNKTIHIILEVTSEFKTPMTRYQRFILHVK